MSYMLAARRRGEKLRATPRVRLSTIHSAKGAEADHVVLMTEMARRTHKEMENNPDDERRVWYVGVTRAREKLTIVNSQTSQECPWV
jgi:superfamily I DNA/RNA helicase